MPRRRRYLVHLFCTHDEDSLACRYIANIRLWTVRIGAHAKTQQYAFVDEYELIETINPLLPDTAPMSVMCLAILRARTAFFISSISVPMKRLSLGWPE